MKDIIPTTKTQAAILLCHAEEYLGTDLHVKEGREIWMKDFRNYDDLKARQLCSTLSDILLGEAKLEAWIADLGTGGCSL